MIYLDKVTKIYPSRYGNRTVLRDINLQVKKGEKIGILGRNGSGKSTLIRLISGIERPNSGYIFRNMSVSWPLAFGGAFQSHLTGLDNVRFICRIYGINYVHIMPFVQDFSELGIYLREPVVRYSSGMRARLAFALSMAIEFDCFLIDEVITVGDPSFHKKCQMELFEKRKDRALILVSHDPNIIKQHCSHASIIENGEIKHFSDIDEAYISYQKEDNINFLSVEHKENIGYAQANVVSNTALHRKVVNERNVLVTSSAQTGGIIAALKKIFPNDRIYAFPIEMISESEEIKFSTQLSQTEFWVSIGKFDLVKKYEILKLNPILKLIKIPQIEFSAFHPDLCYAKKTSTGELTTIHYNSAIAIWAYNNGIEVSDAKKLFNDEVYARLGYFNGWQASVNYLRRSFINLSLDFDKFFSTIKRRECFMHSINLPKICVLIKFAMTISLKMGQEESIFRKEIFLPDELEKGDIWPVYPEISEQFALPSSLYYWKFGGINKYLHGVEEYLDFAYENYSSQKILPRELIMLGKDEAFYSKILGSQIGV